VRRREVVQRNDERRSDLRPETIGTASAALHWWQGYMMWPGLEEIDSSMFMG
jgi:hypothetical protein